ncbi:MAG: response regulator transcription factor [Chloroflexota bacterium]
MSARILIVEDDRNMARVLQINLADSGYAVSVAHDGAMGLALFAEIKPDLVMLDVVLPDMDGLVICRRIRQDSNVPILMMSATAITEEDIAAGLDTGADEYMLKPLGDIELTARIKALLRRARMIPDSSRPLTHYEDDYMRVDINTRRVHIDDHEVRLTPTEFNLLALFLRNDGEVLSFAEILENVWGPEYQTEHHYPRIYVSHLRRKIEPDYKNPTYIHNEYGVGYRFVSGKR